MIDPIFFLFPYLEQKARFANSAVADDNVLEKIAVRHFLSLFISVKKKVTRIRIRFKVKECMGGKKILNEEIHRKMNIALK
jgi:hypothetical protein